MLITEIFMSVEYFNKNQLIFISVVVKFYILTQLSRNVLRGIGFL